MEINPLAKLFVKGAAEAGAASAGTEGEAQLNARVVKSLGGDQFILNIGGKTFVVTSDDPLVEGSALRLLAKQVGGDIMLEVLSMGAKDGDMHPADAQLPARDVYIPAPADSEIPASLFEARPALTEAVKGAFELSFELKQGADKASAKIYSELNELVRGLPVELDNIAQQPQKLESALQDFSKPAVLDNLAAKIESAAEFEISRNVALQKLDSIINSGTQQQPAAQSQDAKAAASFLSSIAGSQELETVLPLFKSESLPEIFAQLKSEMAADIKGAVSAAQKDAASVTGEMRDMLATDGKPLPSFNDIIKMPEAELKTLFEKIPAENIPLAKEIITSEAKTMPAQGDGQAKPVADIPAALERVLKAADDIVAAKGTVPAPEKPVQLDSPAAKMEQPVLPATKDVAPEIKQAVVAKFNEFVKSLPAGEAVKIPEEILKQFIEGLSAQEREALAALLSRGEMPVVKLPSMTEAEFKVLMTMMQGMAEEEGSLTAASSGQTAEAKMLKPEAEKVAAQLVDSLLQKADKKEIESVMRLLNDDSGKEVVRAAEKREGLELAGSRNIKMLGEMRESVRTMSEQVMLNRAQNTVLARQSPSVFVADIPVSMNGKIRSAKFKVYYNKKGKSDSADPKKPMRVVIDLDMTALGEVRSDLNFLMKTISGKVEVDNEEVLSLFNENASELRDNLEKIEFSSNLEFALKKEKEPMPERFEGRVAPGDDRQIDLRI